MLLGSSAHCQDQAKGQHARDHEPHHLGQDKASDGPSGPEEEWVKRDKEQREQQRDENGDLERMHATDGEYWRLLSREVLEGLLSR